MYFGVQSGSVGVFVAVVSTTNAQQRIKPSTLKMNKWILKRLPSMKHKRI